MKFELSRVGPEDTTELWAWKATVQGETVFISPDAYDTEREARSSIAKARKACAGARFAKVESDS